MSEVTNACTPAAMASFFSILPEPPHTATFLCDLQNQSILSPSNEVLSIPGVEIHSFQPPPLDTDL